MSYTDKLRARVVELRAAEIRARGEEIYWKSMTDEEWNLFLYSRQGLHTPHSREDEAKHYARAAGRAKAEADEIEEHLREINAVVIGIDQSKPRIIDGDFIYGFDAEGSLVVAYRSDGLLDVIPLREYMQERGMEQQGFAVEAALRALCGTSRTEVSPPPASPPASIPSGPFPKPAYDLPNGMTIEETLKRIDGWRSAVLASMGQSPSLIHTGPPVPFPGETLRDGSVVPHGPVPEAPEPKPAHAGTKVHYFLERYFVETGEVRIGNEGEWFIDENDDPVHSMAPRNLRPRPILRRLPDPPSPAPWEFEGKMWEPSEWRVPYKDGDVYWRNLGENPGGGYVCIHRHEEGGYVDPNFPAKPRYILREVSLPPYRRA